MGRIRSGLSPASLINALLAGLVTVVCLTAVAATVLPLTGHPVIIITGGSMNPAIPIGSVVVEDPAPITNLVAGDVATFSLPSGVKVTHRVVRVVERPDGPWYEIKGDANEAPDPVLLAAASVVGRVLVSTPLFGYVIWLLHQPSGILAFATGVLALFIAGLLLEEDRVDEPARDPAERPIPAAT